MYIKDVEPIGDIGIDLLDKVNAEELIDRIIEEPLRKPCKAFYRKGIKTIMSSANKNNIVPKGKKPKKKKDVEGRHFYLNGPTFEDAGVGYAWIMLDFDSLSEENKELMLRLEEREDEKGNKVGEEAIWFLHPSIMEDMHLDRKIGKRGMSFEDTSDENKTEEKPKVDSKYVQFQKKCMTLKYNNRYPPNTVVLRMPIDANSTSEEVAEYFCKIAELMKSQRTIKLENNIEEKGREE